MELLFFLFCAAIVYKAMKGYKRPRYKKFPSKKPVSKKVEYNFDELIRLFLYERVVPRTSQKINLLVMKNNPIHGSVIRELQILRDSIDISLSSKKRETAEGRAELALKSLYAIRKNQNYIKPVLMQEIEAVVSNAMKEYHTVLYMNTAEGYVDKLKTLKTQKSKQKYYELAKSVLDEGMRDNISDKSRLKSKLTELDSVYDSYVLTKQF